jgi:hypothetical protein
MEIQAVGKKSAMKNSINRLLGMKTCSGTIQISKRFYRFTIFAVL